MNTMHRAGMVFLFSGCLAAITVSGASLTWTNMAGGAWETAGNWKPNIAPASTNNVTFYTNGAYTIQVDNTTADTDPGGASSWMQVGTMLMGDSAGDAMTLLIGFTNSAKTLVSSTLQVGQQAYSSPTLMITSGVYVVVPPGSTSQTRIGVNANATGTVLITGGMLTHSNTAVFHLGESGEGNMTLDGGKFWANKGLLLGALSGGSGTLIVSNGMAELLDYMRVGSAAGSVGSVSLRGGGASLIATNVGSVIGNAGRGTFGVSNGLARFAALTVANSAGSSGELRVDGGTVQVHGATFVIGSEAGSTGLVVVSGGELIATNTLHQTSPFTIGSYGYGRLETMGGVMRGKNIMVGRYAGSIGEWIVRGGSNYVVNGIAFEVANRNNSVRGLLLVEGGLLQSDMQLDMGVGGGLTNNSRFIVSNGVVSIPIVAMNPASASTASCAISGGTNHFGTLYVNKGGAGTASALFDGGVLWVSNMNARSAFEQGAQIAVSNNGLVYAKFLSVGGDSGSSGHGSMDITGGRVVVSNALYVGSIRSACTGTLSIAGSGVLEMWGAITNGSATPGSGRLTVRDGGTLRFAGTNNPAITLGTGGSCLASNAILEFASAENASLSGNVATKIAYAGTNTLSLNGATNAWVTNYLFGPSPATNFMHLALSNGGVFRGTNTTFAAGSILSVQLAGTAMAQIGRVVDAAALSLGGATLNVTLADGYIPQNGNTFDVLDWGSGPGTFGAVNLPALPGGLTWNDGNLYVTGQLAVRASQPGALILVR